MNLNNMDNEQDKKSTIVFLKKRLIIWLLIPAFIAPFIGFFLYGKLWMFFCVLLSASIQAYPFIFAVSEQHEMKTITVDQLDVYAKSEVKFDLLLRICFAIIAILNSFPFLSSIRPFMETIRGQGFEPYEGGVLVTIMTLLIIYAWGAGALGMDKPSILKSKSVFDSTGQTIEELNQEELERVRAREQRIKKKYEGYVSLGCKVYMNTEKKNLLVNNRKINFEDILDFEIQDNTITKYSASTSSARTDTGSMLGRAVVGGAIFGNTGAIIGGTTGNKTIKHSAYQSMVEHDYKVVITINDINNPSVVVVVKNDEDSLNRISSTLKVILNQNTNTKKYKTPKNEMLRDKE